MTEENQKIAEIVKAAATTVKEVQESAKGVLEEIGEDRESFLSKGSKKVDLGNVKNRDKGFMVWPDDKDDRDVVSEGGKKEKRVSDRSVMSDVVKLDRTRGRFGMYGFYSDHMSTQKEKASREISRLQKKIESELSLTESLLDVGGKDV